MPKNTMIAIIDELKKEYESRMNDEMAPLSEYHYMKALIEGIELTKETLLKKW